ncbi:MAG: Gfo/Idh/MocA family oxidoreductase [Anaerolineae bacterium]|nr:Gfo/Idh/MocA family oxidoreductase [Anaerolineae bacterium]
MDALNIAFIGAGGFANRVHYPSLSEMDDVRLVAVCDLVPEKARETADRYGIPRWYTDYHEMLAREDIDAVYVIMPPMGLRPIVVDCLRAGKHVFTEKPPGYRLEDTREMARVAAEEDRLTMFGTNRRWAPVVMEARRRVLERGEATLVVGEFHKHHLGDRPYYDTESWLRMDIIHTVDTIQFLGGRVERLVTNTRRLYGSEATNSYTALFSFEAGGCGVLCANYASGARVERFEMHGRGIAAYIEAPQVARIYHDGALEPDVLDGPTLAGSDAFYRTYGYFQESRHFIECIREERQPDTNFAYGVELMELIYAIDRGGTI